MKKILLAAALLLVAVRGVYAYDWMKNLPDAALVAQLSIPGTHDSATGNGVALASFAQCQDITLAEQWALGVRAFDLRPKVRDGYLNINHGVAATKLRFDDALFTLRDSLRAHPSEFAIVHFHYDTDFDADKAEYVPLLRQLVESDELKDCFVPFHRGLTVAELRGKMLLISRQGYDDAPFTGGSIRGWCSSLDWAAQTSGSIVGTKVGPGYVAQLYMQDYYSTDNSDAGLQKKADAVTELLGWSATQPKADAASAVWVFNYTSAYPGSISTANGYRRNAACANGAMVDYFKTHEAGPAGVVFMDFCVDQSNGYATRGKELVDTLIAANFSWLRLTGTGITTVRNVPHGVTAVYSLQGERLAAPRRGTVNIVRYADGSVRKVIVR